MARYLSAPVPSKEMPSGVPYIIGNEAAERFSYYGMRTILIVFMTQYLMGRDGELSPMTEETAKGWYHLFMASAYAFPVLGAILSDALLGKYRTIMSLSIVYCLGHLALAVDETRVGLAVGLTLIAIGSGGIKPCVSAHVGDQFGELNRPLLGRVFAWFYFSINVGAFFSTLLTPWLLEAAGPSVAFGVPGFLMLLATWVFWLGRWKFVHVPPGGREFLKESFGRVGRGALLRLLPVYLAIAVFWSLYDQTGSAWVLQAQHMDLNFLGTEWKAAQIQAVNPILVLIYIPLFTYVVYPAIHRRWPLTAMRRMGMGMFITVPSFLIIAHAQTLIDAGETPTIAWQILAYCFLTAAEVMIYQTGLEFTYTQSPRTMKSLIMSFYLLTISAGNLLTAGINFFIEGEDGRPRIEDLEYYLLYAGLMLATAIAFVFIARNYRERTFLQGQETGAEPDKVAP
ncbi:MAG TPA: POT family MFS transporter [Methylomirabilota bacterium]|nr:POT family MFS transporter [Methylomirabilota bacterium]